MDLLLSIWLSHAFGVGLWIILVSILFGPMAYQWYRERSHFDIFETVNIFRLVYFLYFGIPSIYYLIWPRTFPFVEHFGSSLRVVLVMASLGALAFYIGYRVKLTLPWQLTLPAGQWPVRRLAAVVAAFSMVSAVSFILLLEQVGGACYYFTHLGQTNELMSGKTYYLWGILLFKSAALLLLAYTLKARHRPWWLWLLTSGYLALSLLLVSFLGSRILAVIFVFEVLIVIHYLVRKIHLALLAAIMLAVLVVIIGVLGEFRNFSWASPEVCQANNPAATLEHRRALEQRDEETQDPSEATASSSLPDPEPTVSSQEYADAFAKQLSRNLGDREAVLDRYINHYFDSVRTTMMTYENTPDIMRYQYGLTYAQAVLQPIPGSVRPSILLPNEHPSIFVEGKSYARVQSMLAEAYMNFSWLGVFLIPFIIGVVSRLATRLRQDHAGNRWAVLIYASAIGGLMMYIRGYFTGHTALFLMDLLPLLLAMMLLHWRQRGET